MDRGDALALTILPLIPEAPTFHTEVPETEHVCVDLKALVFVAPGDDGRGSYIETRGGTATTLDVPFLDLLKLLGLGVPVIHGGDNAEG